MRVMRAAQPVRQAPAHTAKHADDGRRGPARCNAYQGDRQEVEYRKTNLRSGGYRCPCTKRKG